MDQIKSIFSQLPALNEPNVSRIILTIVTIVGLWILRVIIVRIISKRIEDQHMVYKWRKRTTYITFFIGFLIISSTWFEGFQSLTTYLGLLSAGLAIALRDPLTNLAGWLFILWRHPFDLGDRIEIDQIKGDVIDIRIFAFTLNEIGNWVDSDQSTGRVIHIPNQKVFSYSLANYSSEFRFIWNEIPVLITFESNWKKAKEILLEIINEYSKDTTSKAAEEVRKAARSYLIYYNYLTPTVYTNVKDSGVELTVRYITDPRQRRGSTQDLWEQILARFAECDDIDLAYTTMRIFRNPEEGKPGSS